MFISFLFDQPDFYISWVTIIVFSICCHEAAHAWAAYHEGDTTAVDHGFLTLNPLKVMGLHSLIFLALFGFAWGAVPVRPGNMRRRHSHLLVALSGPATNLAIAGVSAVGFAIASRLTQSPVLMIFGIGMEANFFLLLFNLLPVPMLDGWELWRTLLPALKRVPLQQAQQWGFGILLVILFTGMHRHIWRAAIVLANIFAI